MANRVKVRRLSDEEGRQLQRIVRRGGDKTDRSIVKWRRALVVLASAGGNDVAVIARLVQTSPDRVREMIHAFNDRGMGALDPQWAGGRPRRITTEERQLIVKTARKRPRSLGQPFSRWSIRKLSRYLATKKGRKVVVSPERLRQILAEERITFQRTKTWKESPDPLREEKLARIEHLLEHERDRTFAFDEFGPLAIKPEGGNCWAEMSKPQRLRANYHKPLGTRQLFASYSVGADRLYGRMEHRKGSRPTLRALKAIRALVADGEPIYVILDNLNHHRGRLVVGQSHRGPFRPAGGTHHRQLRPPGPRELATAFRDCIRWRNAHTKDPEILALERKHRAMLRGEAQRRWGQPRARAA